ncbi:hypothetical protein D9758_006952 [Tetrapyrgos nigripes]|uniref:Uncharacterized protein n=1 Tax=Tetrapyrgos nigripes TaxID=182062 RepID=A0A8H5GSW1_9AGAR|nr:hypothetical protein D9758_006952 [Tetrapyrgos nigripes]
MVKMIMVPPPTRIRLSLQQVHHPRQRQLHTPQLQSHNQRRQRAKRSPDSNSPPRLDENPSPRQSPTHQIQINRLLSPSLLRVANYGVPEARDLDGSVRLVGGVNLVNRIPLTRLDRSRSLYADGGKIVGRGGHDGGNIKRGNARVGEVRERQSRDGGHSGDVEMKSGEANTHGVDVNLRRKKYAHQLS